MALIIGGGAIRRTKYGIQFKFAIGELIIIDRQAVHPHIILDQKRRSYLNPLPISITSKETIQVSSLKEFIQKSNGLQYSIHSTVLRVFIDTLEFKKNICRDENAALFFNGTAYVKDKINGQGHRVKIKHTPMEEIVFEMDVESAVGYESNAQLQFDIMERVEGNYYDCTFMYGYSEKKANEEPSRKRRRLNNSNVYCNTGYVSITSMTKV
eukprot:463939_1